MGEVEAYPDKLTSGCAAHRTALEKLLEVAQDGSQRAGSLQVQADKSSGIVVDCRGEDSAAAAAPLYDALFVKTAKVEGDSKPDETARQSEGAVNQPETKETNAAAEKKSAEQLKRVASKKEATRKGSESTKGKGDKPSGKASPAPSVSPEVLPSPPGAPTPGPPQDQDQEKSPPEAVGNVSPVGADGVPYLSTLLLSRGEQELLDYKQVLGSFERLVKWTPV